MDGAQPVQKRAHPKGERKHGPKGPKGHGKKGHQTPKGEGKQKPKKYWRGGKPVDNALFTIADTVMLGSGYNINWKLSKDQTAREKILAYFKDIIAAKATGTNDIKDETGAILNEILMSLLTNTSVKEKAKEASLGMQDTALEMANDPFYYHGKKASDVERGKILCKVENIYKSAKVVAWWADLAYRQLCEPLSPEALKEKEEKRQKRAMEAASRELKPRGRVRKPREPREQKDNTGS